MNTENLLHKVAAVRHFNRFYTRQIGLITGHYLGSPFSVTEARVLYELAHLTNPTATTLINELGLDAGYLSRILKSFIQKGLVEKHKAPNDGRQSYLSLTEKGQMEFNNLNSRSQTGIEGLLNSVSSEDQIRIVNAMKTIETLLDNSSDGKISSSFILRQPIPGDMGWVVKRHGELYAEEYGWEEQFEGLVAGIVAKFVQDFDAKYERCWIAERDGENIGCIFLVKKDEKTAKLRMLLVDPKARGLGLGSKLIDECIRYARSCGYEKMVLWTNSNLYAARHLYEKVGFQLVEQEPHHSYGHDLVGENWELNLR
jgi:DNA-binding MarR family transcriptional regulator/ribosomal protein S18 acetylase RimI-like enzyme